MLRKEMKCGNYDVIYSQIKHLLSKYRQDAKRQHLAAGFSQILSNKFKIRTLEPELSSNSRMQTISHLER